MLYTHGFKISHLVVFLSNHITAPQLLLCGSLESPWTERLAPRSLNPVAETDMHTNLCITLFAIVEAFVKCYYTHTRGSKEFCIWALKKKLKNVTSAEQKSFLGKENSKRKGL